MFSSSSKPYPSSGELSAHSPPQVHVIEPISFLVISSTPVNLKHLPSSSSEPRTPPSAGPPLSSELGTNDSGKARFWPWLVPLSVRTSLHPCKLFPPRSPAVREEIVFNSRQLPVRRNTGQFETICNRVAALLCKHAPHTPLRRFTFRTHPTAGAFFWRPPFRMDTGQFATPRCCVNDGCYSRVKLWGSTHSKPRQCHGTTCFELDGH